MEKILHSASAEKSRLVSNNDGSGGVGTNVGPGPLSGMPPSWCTLRLAMPNLETSPPAQRMNIQYASPYAPAQFPL